MVNVYFCRLDNDNNSNDDKDNKKYDSNDNNNDNDNNSTISNNNSNNTNNNENTENNNSSASAYTLVLERLDVLADGLVYRALCHPGVQVHRQTAVVHVLGGSGAGCGVCGVVVRGGEGVCGV